MPNEKTNDKKERKGYISQQFIQFINSPDSQEPGSEDDKGSATSKSPPGYNGYVVGPLIVIAVAAALLLRTSMIYKPPSPPVAKVGVLALYLRPEPGMQYQPHYLLPLNWDVSISRESHRSPDGDLWVKVKVETDQGPQEGWVCCRHLYRINCQSLTQ